MKEKKQNFISQAHWRARLLCTSTTAAFSGLAKAAFEAGRYVLIIWRLNDDTEFIINGPHPSTLPLPLRSPEWARVLALAAFALFDLYVITPLFGDHTASFMLKKEALEAV